MPTSSNPYYTHRFSELSDAVGAQVKIAGHVRRVRDHGHLLFVDVRNTDRQPANLQLVVRDKAGQEMWRNIPAESAVSVTGRVQARQSGQAGNGSLGQIEVVASDVAVVNRATRVPIRPGDATIGEEVKLSERPLALREGSIRDAIMARDKFLEFARRGARELLGLPEVQTPIITGTSPEGARDFLVPSRRYPGTFYALPQAPQQFKELLMGAGFPGYFQVAPCFRDEDSRADRTPFEHYQFDIEFPWVQQEDVFDNIEKLVGFVAENCSELRLESTTFPRITFHDAIDKYGVDKPDLRFGLEIQDVSAFRPFAESAYLSRGTEDGNVLRAVVVPGGAHNGRKWFDNAMSSAKTTVAKSWVTVGENGELGGPLAKQVPAEAAATLIQKTGLKPGDALVVAAGEWAVTSELLGKVRSQVGKEQQLADPSVMKFAWITDFPHYEQDEATGAWAFGHNPFSRPKGDMEALNTQKPGQVLAYQYDLTCNGVELGSGAIRNHDVNVMVRAFEIAGYTQPQVEKNFPAMYKALQAGMPPHGGIGLGVDRMLALFHGLENVRDGIAFPPTQTARDVIVTAPTVVSDSTLRELGLQLAPSALPHAVSDSSGSLAG